MFSCRICFKISCATKIFIGREARYEVTHLDKNELNFCKIFHTSLISLLLAWKEFDFEKQYTWCKCALELKISSLYLNGIQRVIQNRPSLVVKELSSKAFKNVILDTKQSLQNH